MIVKLKIECTLTIVTGLHIGDNTGFAPIGALDNPVIRDAYSHDPYIPGSSLKGKMRSLLARSMNGDRYILPKVGDDHIRISRLFGSPANKDGNPVPARLQFSDAFLANRKEMLRRGGITEVKSENTINRITSVANPRSMERINRGASFKVVWFYTMISSNELLEDMQTLAEGCKLLNMDYLGGSGSRGYGRVALDHFTISDMWGDLPAGVTQAQLLDCFKDVSDYAVCDL